MGSVYCRYIVSVYYRYMVSVYYRYIVSVCPFFQRYIRFGSHVALFCLSAGPVNLCLLILKCLPAQAFKSACTLTNKQAG